MQVLGLNGVYPRSHDASACLIDGDAVLANVEEERFTRSKKALDTPPHNAVDYCLMKTGRDINNLDAITYGWVGPEIPAQDILPEKYRRMLTKEVPVVQIKHHEAHAASVFYTSPYSEAAILVVDGQGEDESTSIWRGTKDGGLERLRSLPIEASLGYMYAAVSKFCGLGTFGAGKVMGLAPYGKPQYTELLESIYHGIQGSEFDAYGVDEQRGFLTQFTSKLYEEGFPEPTYTYEYDFVTNKSRKMPVITEVHRDMAASAQLLLEQQMTMLAKEAKDLTGSDYLCLAGGVAMNCVTNSLLQNSGLFKDVFVQPGCEDSGIALGSALALTKQETPLQTIYSGPAYSDQEIGKMLDGLGIRAERCDDIASRAAQLLVRNTVIGWFQGGLEYGPRALGGRSILANPSNADMKSIVNSIKHRENWRPFGPSVLAESAADLFVNSHESKYMLRSFTVRDAWREKLAAVVHIDGSTRPQTVEMQDNPRYYQLIKAFQRITGTPAVLNTSFNDYNEPLVNTPLDALRTYNSTNLGALVLGNYLLVK